MPIIWGMTGMTISEMADKLNLPRDTVMRRILRGRYKPLTKDALYSMDVFEAIKDVPPRGRPPKARTEEPAKAKPNKPPKTAPKPKK
jgi:hypothetical protein